MVQKGKAKGNHRKRRERAIWPGMTLHQDGSTHQWVQGVYWDLIVTMDDATNEHYTMFFIDGEGTSSSFVGVLEVIESRGLFFIHVYGSQQTLLAYANSRWKGR